MAKEDLIKAQIILSINRVNQATSIIRAIRTSIHPVHPLFTHIEHTQYFTIISDVSKLFDRTGDNLLKMTASYETQISQVKFEELKQSINEIRNKHRLLLKKVKDHRNKFTSHIDGVYIYKAVSQPTSDMIGIELGDVQKLLREIIDVLIKVSFLTSEEKAFLANRIPPLDAQKLLGLKTDPKFIRSAIEAVAGKISDS